MRTFWMMIVIQNATHRRATGLLVGVAAALAACGTPKPVARPDGPTSTAKLTPPLERTSPLNLEQTKQALVGRWVSIAPEIRPSLAKNPDGTLKPFFLQRDFSYAEGDRFELTILNSVDPYGKVPLARIKIAGHMTWREAHPIVNGAFKVNFVADQGYEVTPLVQGFADLLNKVASTGSSKWEVGATQSIFGKTFVPFGLVEGKNFMEFDLVYITHGMLFWGARNIDGRGFDTEENRPTNLQIPLVRPAT